MTVTVELGAAIDRHREWCLRDYADDVGLHDRILWLIARYLRSVGRDDPAKLRAAIERHRERHDRLGVDIRSPDVDLWHTLKGG